MLKKENNQLVDITNISESLNIQRDTRQHSEQTKALVPLNNLLGSTHVTSTVSNNDVCYRTSLDMHMSIFLEEGNHDTKTALPCGTLVYGKVFGSKP